MIFPKSKNHQKLHWKFDISGYTQMPGNAPEMSIPLLTKRMRIDADIYSPLIVETRSYWQINSVIWVVIQVMALAMRKAFYQPPFWSAANIPIESSELIRIQKTLEIVVSGRDKTALKIWVRNFEKQKVCVFFGVWILLLTFSIKIHRTFMEFW